MLNKVINQSFKPRIFSLKKRKMGQMTSKVLKVLMSSPGRWRAWEDTSPWQEMDLDPVLHPVTYWLKNRLTFSPAEKPALSHPDNLETTPLHVPAVLQHCR